MPLPPRRTSAALAVLVLALPACSAAESDDDEQPAKAGSWTVLQYSMADTNLEPFMVEDINELGAVETGDQLRVRAFVDRSAEYGDAELLDQGAWVGGRVLDLGADGTDGTAETVEDLGDVNSADPAVLSQFIADGIEALPADHYALIISDHGASWPGIGPDEGSEGETLDLADLTTGISDGLEQAGVDKLDLLGFDACLMASYEVASAMAPLADRMLASQELEPGHGWDYGSLQVLVDEPTTTVDELGSTIIDGFEGQAKESGTEDAITLALLDLTKMDAVDTAVGDFAGELAARADTVSPAVGRAEASTLGFARDPDPANDAHLRDLGMLASTIGVEALDVSDQADTLVRAINDVVVDKVAGQATSGATGLSIYLPPTADLEDAAYADVASGDTWRAFLDSFHAAGDAIPAAEQPAFDSPDGTAEVSDDGDGSITLTGTYNDAAADNLSEATLQYAILNDDGSRTYYGQDEAFLSEDGTPTADGNYDFSIFQLDDGDDTAYAYVELTLSEDAETAYFNVPVTYYEADDEAGDDPQQALLALVLDIESQEFGVETLYAYDEASGTYGEMTPDPEGILVPDVLTVGADGEESWDPTSTVGVYADLDALGYEFVPVEAGTELQVDLSVTDYADNSSTVSAQVTAP